MYLVQFREHTRDYFVTDCAFRDAQFELARRYVRTVMDALGDMAEGRVFDVKTRTYPFQYTRSQHLQEKQIAAIFGEPEEFVDVNGSDGLDDDPFVRYEGPDNPAITYN